VARRRAAVVWSGLSIKEAIMPTLALRAAGLLVLVLAGALRPAAGVWMGDYLPAHGPSHWTYLNRHAPFDSYTDAVFDTASFGGVVGVKFGEPDEYVIARNTGSRITVPAAVEQGVVIDFEPDIELGWFEDGADFVVCEAGYCDTSLVRDWQAIDPALRALYMLDPAWDDVWVFASYDADHPPNFQNTVIASDLPAGVEPPAGAVTGLEWYQRGVGMIANLDVDAESGGFEDFYVLVEWAVGVPDAAASPPATLAPVHPNPFNARAVIRYATARAGPVRLTIADLRGRRLRTLVDATLPTGEHVAVWDGRTEASRRAPSGIYLVRLEAAGRTWTRAVSLVQ
jgi:hypothetical protein